MKNMIFIAVAALALVMGSCKKDSGINIFTLEQDKQFGAQLKAQIDSSPSVSQG